MLLIQYARKRQGTVHACAPEDSKHKTFMLRKKQSTEHYFYYLLFGRDGGHSCAPEETEHLTFMLRKRRSTHKRSGRDRAFDICASEETKHSQTLIKDLDRKKRSFEHLCFGRDEVNTCGRSGRDEAQNFNVSAVEETKYSNVTYMLRKRRSTKGNYASIQVADMPEYSTVSQEVCSFVKEKGQIEVATMGNVAIVILYFLCDAQSIPILFLLTILISLLNIG